MKKRVKSKKPIKEFFLAFGFVALVLAAPLYIATIQKETTKDSYAVTPPDLRFATYNMCGNVCWRADAPENPSPGVDSRGEVKERVKRILSAIDNWNPDILFINETCYSQYQGLRSAMTSRGYKSTYVTFTQGGQCDDFDSRYGTKFGIAIFSKGTIPTTQQVYKLPGSDTIVNGFLQQMYLLCADTTLRGKPTKACAAHLSNDSPTRMEQTKYITNLAKNWVTKMPTIIAGDLNALPPSEEMGLFYNHNGGTGLFQEADENDPAYFSAGCTIRCRSGEITFNETKKIDYIFLSASHFKLVQGDAKSRFPNPISDHNFYTASAYWAK